MCPTIGVIENTFADKTNDSRYDGTFTTVYRGKLVYAYITEHSSRALTRGFSGSRDPWEWD